MISISSDIWQTRSLIASSPVFPGSTRANEIYMFNLLTIAHRTHTEGVINHTNFTQKRVHFHNWFTAINCWICLSWGNLLARASSSLEAKAIISFWQIASWNRVRARNEWPQIFHRRASKLEPRLNDGDHHHYSYTYIFKFNFPRRQKHAKVSWGESPRVVAWWQKGLMCAYKSVQLL